MNSVELISEVQDLIPSILSQAGLKNGDKMISSEALASKDTLFWNKQVPDVNNSKKASFVIWDVVDANPIGHADNKVAIRHVYVSIDIYTKLGALHQSTKELLKKINEAFENEEWNFELVASDSIDNMNGLTQIRYSATKKI